MPQFDWSEDESVVLDGLDTELTPEEQALQKPPKPKPLSPQQLQARAATMARQVMRPPVAAPPPEEPEFEMSEAERRLAKAQCYKAILESQLLQGDDEASLEVESEIQEMAQKRLEELLGIRPAETPQVDVAALLAQLPKNPFTDDEVEALKVLAGRLLHKPTTPTAPPSVKPVPAQAAPAITAPPTVKPAVSARQTPPGPSIAPTSPPKRGRGRPRKSPCAKCGGMICACPKPNLSRSAPQQPTQAPEEQIEVLSDGTKIKTVGNKRYKLVQKEVVYRDGSTGVEEIALDITPTPKLPTATPYPNEMQVAAIAATEAQQNLSKVQSNPKLANAVQAAMLTPAKE